jgi:hypothetical protein
LEQQILKQFNSLKRKTSKELMPIATFQLSRYPMIFQFSFPVIKWNIKDVPIVDGLLAFEVALGFKQFQIINKEKSISFFRYKSKDCFS